VAMIPDQPRQEQLRYAEACRICWSALTMRLQVRAAKAQGSGKLAEQLAAQKKENALEQAAYENRRAREADAAQEARNWN
jgi:hypothetical protein